MSETIDDLVRDGPRTQLAASRFKRIVRKAGTDTAGALRDILVGVASEATKKAIWG